MLLTIPFGPEILSLISFSHLLYKMSLSDYQKIIFVLFTLAQTQQGHHVQLRSKGNLIFPLYIVTFMLELPIPPCHKPPPDVHLHGGAHTTHMGMIKSSQSQCPRDRNGIWIRPTAILPWGFFWNCLVGKNFLWSLATELRIWKFHKSVYMFLGLSDLSMKTKLRLKKQKSEKKNSFVI